jgi:phage-related holin
MKIIYDLAQKAQISEVDDFIIFFAELVAQECVDIAESAAQVGLPAAPIIRRHFNLPEPK